MTRIAETLGVCIPQLVRAMGQVYPYTSKGVAQDVEAHLRVAGAGLLLGSSAARSRT